MNYTVAEQRSNCEKLLAILEQLPDEKYDHDHFYCATPGCGTTSCALGCAGLSGQFPTLKYDPVRYQFIVDDLPIEVRFIDYHANEVRFIDYHANAIFGPDAYGSVFCEVDYKGDHRYWERRDVIEALRRHMEGLV